LFTEILAFALIWIIVMHLKLHVLLVGNRYTIMQKVKVGQSV